MKNIVGVVILYHPDSAVVNNIKSYADNLERLFIIDNSPQKNNAYASLASNKIQYLHDGNNEGIAKRLNQAIALAKTFNASLLLTMDQDSFFEEKEFDKYTTAINNFTNIDSLGMFGLEYENATTTQKPYEQDVMLITSGSIINMQLLDKIGGFDELLFIDAVDDEFCLKILSKGFHTIKFNNIFLHHSLGETKLFRSLKSLKATKRVLHTPIRLYYIIRNNLYLKSRYHKLFKDYFRTKQTDINNRIKNNLLYGKEKISTAKMIVKAYRDFKNNKMGKFEN